jgi:hypothetical protein
MGRATGPGRCFADSTGRHMALRSKGKPGGSYSH